MVKSARRLGALLGLTAMVLLVGAPPALAHESRRVGAYEFVVGWDDEPTYTGAKNAVGLRISDFQTEEPIGENLPVEIDVEVIFESESTSLTMEPSFSDPSYFTATIAPSRPGEYTFHFTGTVGDLEVDEEFTSGPDTFGSPQELAEIQFPVQDPSTADLAQRLDQEIPRVQEEAVAAAQNAGDTATDDVDSARTVAFIALAHGVIAVLLALVGVMRNGRSRRSAPAPAASESKG